MQTGVSPRHWVVSDVARSDTSSAPLDDSLDLVLDAVPRNVSIARHAVADLLDRAGGIPAEVVEDVVLLVSELVTNVVLHARTTVRVMARADGRRVIVAIGDDDPHNVPRRRDRGLSAPTGRGLRLLDLLASSWGVEVGAASKVVWFEAAFEPALVDVRSS